MFRLRGALLACALCCFAVAQDSSETARSDVREVLRASECQTSLPGEVEGERGGSASPRGTKGGRARPGDSDPAIRLGAGGLIPAQLLLWAAVGVAVVLLVAAVARSRWGGEAPAAVEPVRGARVPAPAAAPEPDEPDHERLAAAGDFRAAVHALLRRAIEAWSARGEAVPLHATAREVLRRVRRAFAAEPFAELVTVVERVHFGGATADRGLYETSREQLRAWEAACQRPR